MNLRTIHKDIEELAMENMTEDGIHHDDFPDRQDEYAGEIVRQLAKDLELE